STPRHAANGRCWDIVPEYVCVTNHDESTVCVTHIDWMSNHRLLCEMHSTNPPKRTAVNGKSRIAHFGQLLRLCLRFGNRQPHNSKGSRRPIYETVGHDQ